MQRKIINKKVSIKEKNGIKNYNKKVKKSKKKKDGIKFVCKKCKKKIIVSKDDALSLAKKFFMNINIKKNREIYIKEFELDMQKSLTRLLSLDKKAVCIDCHEELCKIQDKILSEIKNSNSYSVALSGSPKSRGCSDKIEWYWS